MSGKFGKTEHQNNISVNVYGYEDKKIFSLRITNYDRCKESRIFIIYHCWQNITLCIGKKLEHTDIETM